MFFWGVYDWPKIPPALFRFWSPDSGDPGPPGLVGGRTLGNSKMAALRLEFCSVPEELPGCHQAQNFTWKPLGTCPVIWDDVQIGLVYHLIQTPCDYHRTCNSEQKIDIIRYNNNSIIIITIMMINIKIIIIIIIVIIIIIIVIIIIVIEL